MKNSNCSDRDDFIWKSAVSLIYDSNLSRDKVESVHKAIQGIDGEDSFNYHMDMHNRQDLVIAH